MTGDAIDPHDRGFTLGDGLFETLLVEAGVLRQLDAHLDRLSAGCAALGLPAPDRAVAEAAMRDALAEAGLQGERTAVRLSWTAGAGGRGLDRPQALAPRMAVTAARAPEPVGPARLAVSTVRRNDQSPASRLKTLAYLDNVLARREARAAGADEALMLNTRGELAGAAAANLFWLCEGRLFTPALGCGVLAGITRGRVMAAARARGVAVEEVAQDREILSSAEAVFLTNSLIGVRQVAAIDHSSFPQSRLADELAAALDAD